MTRRVHHRVEILHNDFQRWDVGRGETVGEFCAPRVDEDHSGERGQPVEELGVERYPK
jgi:hypothetical protein